MMISSLCGELDECNLPSSSLSRFALCFASVRRVRARHLQMFTEERYRMSESESAGSIRR